MSISKGVYDASRLTELEGKKICIWLEDWVLKL